MKLNDNITVIKDLGAGAFGQVYLCKYQKDGFSKEVAVKKVNNQDNKEKVIKEALLNSELNHPNIVQIYNVEFDSNNNILFIYEYVEGTSLREFLESNSKVNLGVAVYIFNSLLKGIEFAHSKNIIHHDISPRNIILSIHGEVKVLDFGLAKLQGSYQADLSEISGSISYYDPYLIQNKKSYDKEADLYSAILIFYELLTGRRFFPSSSPVDTIEFLKGFHGVDDIDLEEVEEDCLREILKHGLDSKREKRFLISEIRERLKEFKAEQPNVFLPSRNEKNSEKTFSQKKVSSNSNFKRLLFSILAISILFLLIGLGAFFYRSNDAIFYVRNESGLYSASIGEIDKNTTKFQELSQLFSNKSCDYYFGSFFTSVVLLDTNYLKSNSEVQSSIESRITLMDRFYKAKSFMDEKCASVKHRKLSGMIKSFEADYLKIKKEKDRFPFEKSAPFKNIMYVFEKDNNLIYSYDEITVWLKKYYFNIKSIIKNDVFRTPKPPLFGIKILYTNQIIFFEI